MPTGYTAAIADGITFKQYALNCARAFGALVLMRDEPSDAQIPERFEPSKYHADALAVASDRLTQLRLMNLEDAEAAARAEYAETLARHNERNTENQELRAKYEAMLAQVLAWAAPTPDHLQYKEFMASQIRESIECDCREYDDAPKLQRGDIWRAEAIESAEKSIEYHTRENAEEIKLTEIRNAWIKALRDALP